jgi:hypothetical protein
VSVLSGSLPALLLGAALALPQAVPQTFDLVGTVSAGADAKGGITVPMTASLERFTPDFERTKMTDGLKYNGYPGFLNALREAPQVGTLDVAGETFKIRWAREQPNDTGRVITLVTDQPVAFIGRGRRGAKPTAGYEVAVIQLTLDKTGHGTGLMAAAARVKPGGETGVRIDSYTEKPVTLTVALHGAK